MPVNARAFLAAALDALVEPVLMTDADGILTFANAVAADVFAADKDVGQPVTALLERLPARLPDGRWLAASRHPIALALAQRQAVIGAELTLERGGEAATYVVNTVVLRGPADPPLGTVTVFHDVTGARRLERELADHARRLEILVDLVSDAVSLVGADGRLLFMNDVARRIFGHDLSDITSPTERAARLQLTDAEGALLPLDRLPLVRALRGETLAGLEITARSPDGTTRRLLVSTHPLRAADGAVQAAVATWKDITEERRALAELQRARQRAEEASRSKDEFIAALSHELRTPLQPILGWTEVLRRHGRLDDVTSRALEAIHRNIRQQVRLVDDLLDLSRIVHGKLALRFETFDLREQVRAATEAFEEPAVLRRLHLSTTLPPRSVPMWGDAARVQQIVANLVGNALKFTPAGGRVMVRLATLGEGAVLEVEDTGEGIAASELATIFEPFRQGVQASRRGGLGIGLDLVRRLSELHGGTVTARSGGPGQGACFRVELPLSRTDAPVAAGPAASAARLRDRSVVVVEDNDDTREVLKLMLQAEGAAVEAAGSGEAGLRAVTRVRPDVVLCDIGLPDMDGTELARRLREDTTLAGTRLIALTGYGQAEDIREAIRAGFDAHVTKPVVLEQLVALLARPRR